VTDLRHGYSFIELERLKGLKSLPIARLFHGDAPAPFQN
jgi:hypothetical protein